MLDRDIQPLIPSKGIRRLRLATGGMITSAVGVAMIGAGFLAPEKTSGPGDDPRIALFFLGGIVLLIGLFIWAMGANWQRKLSRLAADYYVYWTYEPEQWRAHVEANHRQRRWAPLLVGAFVGLPIAGGLIASAVKGHTMAGSITLMWVAGTVIAPLFGALCGFLTYAGLRRRHRRLLEENGDVFIGPTGVYISGDFWPWFAFGQRVERAELNEGPPKELVFLFRGQSKHGSTTNLVRIPVPPGRDSEGHAVLELVRRCCGI